MFCRTTMASPVGTLVLVASDRGIAAALWPHERVGRVEVGDARDSDHPVLVRTIDQLTEYFAGRRTGFDLPLDLHGTPFQRDVWAALLDIPYGTTTTYGRLAARLGEGRRARAVGAAVGRNPVSIVVPCHRVIGHDGSLTGFAGGLEAKQRLLALEATTFDLSRS